MSFLRGDPRKSAIKHEKRAREWQDRGNEAKAAREWLAAGRDYIRIPDFKRAHESFLQAAQFYLALKDTNNENAALHAAVDVAIAKKDYEAAAKALDQVTRIGTRLRDDDMLLHTLALKTIIFIAANDLAKAKETHREALKVEKRLDQKRAQNPLFLIASTLTTRFIEGETIPEDTVLPSRVNESENIDRLVDTLLRIFSETKNSILTLSLDRTEVKRKDHVSGHCSFQFSTPLQIVRVKLTLPPNIALIEDFELPENPVTKYKLPFAIEPRLPGTFNVGPLSATMQKEKQQFLFTSNIVSMDVAAAKPRITLTAEATTPLHTQEEFELIVKVNNTSLGDASEVNIAITLPPTLICKTGTLEKRIITLPAQQDVSFPLYIIATKAGTHEGTIICTHKAPSGTTRKVENTFSIEVLPRIPKEKD
ncbi:MAG: tetratricopeptide repeat protein [Candidatus Hodarchaeota archaeon]